MNTKISSITFREKPNGEMAIDARYRIELPGSIPAAGFLDIQVDIDDKNFLELTVQQLFDDLNRHLHEALSQSDEG